MSGVGKSSIVAQLVKLGYRAIDTDDPGWVTLRDDGERVWVEEKMQELLMSLKRDDSLVISGTVVNQGNFYRFFDYVVLLSAPLEVMEQRIQKRKENSYGKAPKEWSDIVRNNETVEPLLRRGADLEIRTDQPLEEIVSSVVKLLER